MASFVRGCAFRETSRVREIRSILQSISYTEAGSMSSSSLSFRDQLGFVSKKKKKKKGGSQKNGGDNTTNVDGDGPSLGTFPDSVHKLWALRKPGGWSRAEAPLSLPDTGGAIAICLTIVDQLPHENLWRRWLDGSGRKDRRGRVGRMHFHAKYPDKVRRLAHNFVVSAC